jgi:hypothetical protein
MSSLFLLLLIVRRRLGSALVTEEVVAKVVVVVHVRETIDAAVPSGALRKLARSLFVLHGAVLTHVMK